MPAFIQTSVLQELLSSHPVLLKHCMVPQLWVSVDEPMQLLLPPQVAVPWQVRLRLWLPFVQALQELQVLQLLLVGTFTPPPQAPLH